MKKYGIIAAVIGLFALGFTACEPNTPIPEYFPKKHLIEEFTGQTCGYCPYGMDCIHDFIQNDSNWIVVLHHYGYAVDHFTIVGSKTISTTLNVNGAPNMTIDRTVTKTSDGNALVFHPGYLPEIQRSSFASTTYASVVISTDYDDSSRELKVHVNGAVAKKDVKGLKLTVMVKESGMIDTQSDYYKTFEGWQEFRHTNAVRAILTDAKGNDVTIKNQRYAADYTVTIDEKWVAENCMVVAFLSEDFKPVIQAEQAPVVAGTKGGSDIQHGGIKPVSVPDYYPEPSATATTKGYSGLDADTLTVAYTYVEPETSMQVNSWTIMAYNTAQTLKIGKTTCIPFTYLYLFTELDETTIPEGEYEFNSSMNAGSAFAGYIDIEYQEMGGSTFYYISRSYFNQGYLMPEAQWLIVSGKLIVSADGWEVVGKARNGSDIHLIGTSSLTKSSGAPRKLQRL